MNNLWFNPVYFKIEFGDKGFSCKKWSRLELKSMPQKFEAIVITRPLQGRLYYLKILL